MSVEERLARWLKGALEVSGLSQAELARRLTVSLHRPIGRGAVYKICAGKRPISGGELLETAQICGVPVPQPAAFSKRQLVPTAPPDAVADADRGTAS